MQSLRCLRRLRRLRRLLAPHFLRPCYRLCHLRRLQRRDACGAAWHPSVPRSRSPQRSHRLRRGFRLSRFRR
jgi:hypothetical protein